MNADQDIPGLLLQDLPDFPSGDLKKENKEYTVREAFEKAVKYVDAQSGGIISKTAVLESNGDIAIRPYEMDLQG